MQNTNSESHSLPQANLLFNAKMTYRIAQLVAVTVSIGTIILMVATRHIIAIILGLVALGLMACGLLHLRSRISKKLRNDAINMVLIIRDWMRVNCPYLDEKNKSHYHAFFCEPQTDEDYHRIISESWFIAMTQYQCFLKGNAENDGYAVILKFIPPKSFI